MNCVRGDFFAAIPIEADLYLLKGVLQQWDDGEPLAILRNCRERDARRREARHHRAAHAGARRPTTQPPSWLDLHMMTITGGRARSRAEFEALLAESSRVDAGEGDIHHAPGLAIHRGLPSLNSVMAGVSRYAGMLSSATLGSGSRLSPG